MSQKTSLTQKDIDGLEALELFLSGVKEADHDANELQWIHVIKSIEEKNSKIFEYLEFMFNLNYNHRYH